ncbi:hypothetical protein DFH07DRAFT_773660 [Mycena maculata]|uniref:Hydrophobin n=1 Tax=Mycena maculata TaxID=230809 RepID=A0AAD7J2K9_9AGAR|nr:hypothetical protein DFH07DRAFT_773660 [Mycena maculata]
MFSKLSVLTMPVLITLAAAIPNTTPPITTPTSNQCCMSVVSFTSTTASAVAVLLGLDLTGLDVSVGFSCSPITVAGNNWYVQFHDLPSTQRLTGTQQKHQRHLQRPQAEWGGLIAINCVPITAWMLS